MVHEITLEDAVPEMRSNSFVDSDYERIASVLSPRKMPKAAVDPGGYENVDQAANAGEAPISLFS